MIFNSWRCGGYLRKRRMLVFSERHLMNAICSILIQMTPKMKTKKSYSQLNISNNKKKRKKSSQKIQGASQSPKNQRND